jgi:hypothetical protein
VGTRRSVLVGILGSVAVASIGRAQEPLPSEFIENQQGDPAGPVEQLKVNVDELSQLIVPEVKAAFAAKDDDFGTHFLKSAESFIGLNRQDNEGEISEMLDLFGLPFRSEDGSFIPFCAAGLAFAAAMAYADFLSIDYTDINRVTKFRAILADIDHWYYYPSPSVIDASYVAMGKRRWVAGDSGVTKPKPGWIVVYNWDGGKTYEHVGLVERYDEGAGELHTIEFNTTPENESNGGHVARRTRSYNATVIGFIRTDRTPQF